MEQWLGGRVEKSSDSFVESFVESLIHLWNCSWNSWFIHGIIHGILRGHIFLTISLAYFFSSASSFFPLFPLDYSSHTPLLFWLSLTYLFSSASSFFLLFPLHYFSHSPSFLTFSHLLIFSYLFFKAAISSSSLISCPSMPISLCLHYSLSYATCQFVFRAESLPVEAKCRIPTVVQLASA